MTQFADQVFFGKIITGDSARPTAGGFAVKGGRFCAVSQASAIQPLIGPDTVVTRLSGGCIVPGMTEGHAHVTLTTELLFGAHLYGKYSVNDYLDTIRAYRAAHPELKVLTGKGYITSVFGDCGPTAALLDLACPDLPAIISAEDCHSVWINTRAMQMIGLTRDTPEVPLGVIVRFPDTGEPTGWLKEAAESLTAPILPPYSIEDYKEAILSFQEMALSGGITNCFEPLLGARKDFRTRLEAYHQLDQQGKLSVTFHIAYPAASAANAMRSLQTAIELRDTYRNDPHLQLTTIKLYADGVLENHTARLLEPYADEPGDYGNFIWEQDALNAFVLQAEQAHFLLHTHAIGDGAVEQVLNAYEYAADHRAPAAPRPRHAITHLQLMTPQQITRMARDGVIAVVNPYWHFKDSLYFDALEIPYLGTRRAESEYPLASLVCAGVHVSQASDWPVTVPANTFKSLHLMVNRTEPGYAVDSALKPSECLSALEGIEVLSAGGAYQMNLDEKKGSISVDKDADFVIIDSDVLTMEPQRISTTRVLSTYVHGQKVWSSIQQA